MLDENTKTGASSIEFIETFFSSPLRTVAMCVFGIGLPSSLFRQLSPAFWQTWLVGSITMAGLLLRATFQFRFERKTFLGRKALLLPCRFRSEQRQGEANADTLNVLETEQMRGVGLNKRSANVPYRGRPDVNIPQSSRPHLPSLITVTLAMRSDGLWPWYEATLETLAVGICLYGTISPGEHLVLDVRTEHHILGDHYTQSGGA
ncbi:uncharacterized protein BT62DRAFT_1075049 [Guyanagaster necrorhizus]|uniref:Uncharacterized protein n=1 Tax=Guyanagaster necrorhizus TaxID=856835 RepID=A0A9P7VUG0_9AGAR|nr:uncharacterized protein BT62DRAFT_1075049 [Guyanagaster necrorhizus MCA 3950]KAG7447676.1 hypothetical protein BT62DRAFT_1075049 [Guyanagaster necrorhizus MCA 3950]